MSGALAYVLLPVWATQSPREQAAGQQKIAYRLVCSGLVLAVQLLASLAIAVINRTKAGTPERQQAVLISIGWLGGFNGQNLMWLLNAVFAFMAVA